MNKQKVLAKKKKRVCSSLTVVHFRLGGWCLGGCVSTREGLRNKESSVSPGKKEGIRKGLQTPSLSGCSAACVSYARGGFLRGDSGRRRSVGEKQIREHLLIEGRGASRVMNLEEM